jgi:hypothetical protein
MKVKFESNYIYKVYNVKLFFKKITLKWGKSEKKKKINKNNDYSHIVYYIFTLNIYNVWMNYKVGITDWY